MFGWFAFNYLDRWRLFIANPYRSLHRCRGLSGVELIGEEAAAIRRARATARFAESRPITRASLAWRRPSEPAHDRTRDCSICSQQKRRGRQGGLVEVNWSPRPLF
jgi:hypothetical protein